MEYSWMDSRILWIRIGVSGKQRQDIWMEMMSVSKDLWLADDTGG
jgi:hypothetical protein